MPPIVPGSVVSVKRSKIFSSAATFATPSGMPTPKLTTSFALSSSAARRAMIFRSPSGIGGSDESGTRIWPEYDGLYCSPKVCM